MIQATGGQALLDEIDQQGNVVRDLKAKDAKSVGILTYTTAITNVVCYNQCWFI